MKRSIDQSTDYSRKELYQYFRGVDLPDFVKEAELDDHDAFLTLPKTAFADPLNKLFPINSKARVYTSNAYFVKKTAALKKLWGDRYVQEVKGNLQKAAEIFGIEEDLRKYSEYHDTPQVNSISVKIAGDEIELFKINNAYEVKQAADEFVTNLNHYPFQWRRGIATQLLKSAEDFRMDEIPDLVCKYAGVFYPEVMSIADEVLRRSNKLASAENVSIYKEIAENAQYVDSPEQVFKIAETLYLTEKMEGLYDKPKIAKLLGDPVDKLFPITFTKAAEMLDVVKMGDEMFDKKDLESVPSEIFEQAFGVEINPKSAEDTDVLATMPRSDVAIFKQLSGLKPI